MPSILTRRQVKRLSRFAAGVFLVSLVLSVAVAWVLAARATFDARRSHRFAAEEHRFGPISIASIDYAYCRSFGSVRIIRGLLVGRIKTDRDPRFTWSRIATNESIIVQEGPATVTYYAVMTEEAHGWPFLCAMSYVIIDQRTLQPKLCCAFNGPTDPRRLTNSFDTWNAIPYSIILPGLFMNAACYSLPVVLMATAWSVARSLWRRRQGRCVECGYQCGTLDRCPECGDAR